MRRYLALLLFGLLAMPPPAIAAGVGLQQVPGKGAVSFVQLPDGTYKPAQADASGNIITSGGGGGGSIDGNVGILDSTDTQIDPATDATDTNTAATAVSTALIHTDTAASAASLATLAGAISNSIPAGANLIGHTDGAAASGASVAGNPNYEGCRAATASPTAVTDGQVVGAACGVEGKRIVLPFSIKENSLAGAANTTGTGATTIIAAQGASIKIYVTSAQCFREDLGTTLIRATLNDSASTPIAVPAGGGSNPTFQNPLVVAANTALTFTMSSGVTTAYCNAQGFKGP